MMNASPRFTLLGALLAPLNSACAPGEMTAGRNGPLAFAAAIEELANCGVLTAVVCSVLNERDHPATMKLDEDLADYVPPTPVVLPYLGRSLDGSDIDPQSQRVSANLCSRLVRAKALLLPRLDGRGPQELMTWAEIDALVGNWRAAASAALVAVYEIERIADGAGYAVDAARLDLLSALLIGVRDGRAPCLANGRPDVPEWAQRRRHRRVLLNSDAIAFLNGQRKGLLATDVSVGGLGLDFAEGARLGDSLEVTLAGGRTLAGRVVWTNGARAGLAFHTPLRPNDPLVSAG